MKIIIKNDSKETVKNPNVKIIETTEASFANQTVFIEENDVPIIKYTDTESMYFVKDLDNLYDRKSKFEVLLDITTDNLELIGSGASEPVDPRPYKVYTALLTQTGTDAPVAIVLENTLGNIFWSRRFRGTYEGALAGAFTENKTTIQIIAHTGQGYTTNSSVANKDIVEISTSNELDRTADNVLKNTPIEIRVYN